MWEFFTYVAAFAAGALCVYLAFIFTFAKGFMR